MFRSQWPKVACEEINDTVLCVGSSSKTYIEANFADMLVCNIVCWFNSSYIKLLITSFTTDAP
jgi:hypothetical protein